MKIVYLTPTLSSPAGMERVLHNKVCWLINHGGYEITIVTTDQGSAPPFFKFPLPVKIIDLGINYSKDYNKSPILREFSLLRKRIIHKKKLSHLLFEEQPDLTIALFPAEISIVPTIKDGSKKIIEFHSNRLFRLNQGYKGIHRLIAHYRTRKDSQLIRQFDHCVVLTNEARHNQWKDIKNVEAIPNAITPHSIIDNTCSVSHRVIAVGRLIFEKGFDRLIDAWSLLPQEIRNKWKLDIYGDGPLKSVLTKQIEDLKINTSVSINTPTKRIFDEYSKSAFLVMTSYSEGFCMAILEALSVGIPVISFDFQFGPKEMIINGSNGLLVKNGDIRSLSESIARLINDNALREQLASNAKMSVSKYQEDNVMHMWEDCFKRVLEK